jgi:hypothetical protein
MWHTLQQLDDFRQSLMIAPEVSVVFAQDFGIKYWGIISHQAIGQFMQINHWLIKTMELHVNGN